MKHKKTLIISCVLCFLFLLLSSTMIQPIRAVTASSNSMPNIQKLSDNTFEVAIGNSTLIMENQPNNCFNATLITANGNTTTFETVLRAVTNQTALPNGANSTPAIMQKVLLVNGEVAGNLPINNQGMPQPTPQSAGNIKNPMPLASTTYYWWDGVLFAQGDGYNYPHPERSAYGISSSIDWVYSGNQLYHYQMDNTLSETIAYGTSEAFGEFVGTLIATGGLGDPAGDIIGAMVAILVSGFIYDWESSWLLDEAGCIWWWFSESFTNWVDSNEWTLLFEFALDPAWAAADLLSVFYSMGYIRAGSVTFYDGIGAGNPSPPPPSTYVSSIAQYSTWDYGSVNNPWGLTGSYNDGSFVQLYGGNYGDGANVVGSMNDQSHGSICLYCYSGSGYYTHVYTYVSYNDNNDWTQTSAQTVYGDGSGAHWVYCGSYSGNFRYIAIAAIDDNGMSANLFVNTQYK